MEELEVCTKETPRSTIQQAKTKSAAISPQTLADLFSLVLAGLTPQSSNDGPKELLFKTAERRRKGHDSKTHLMQKRLLDTGLVGMEDFEFVPDCVSKEIVNMDGKVPHPKNDENVSHVKTGVWEVIYLEDDGTPKDPCYFVTGVSMDDGADQKKLRKLVFAGQTNKRRPKLRLAPCEVAEELVGFKSGTMAPICHSKNMKLFLEESLVTDASNDAHRCVVGSGLFGQCLSIPLRNFLEIARSNPEGFELGSIIRKRKTKNTSIENKP